MIKLKYWSRVISKKITDFIFIKREVGALIVSMRHVFGS
jgi:hypothetical protein